ncbi:MAG TPA: ABC transporter ATP-binding protein [Candidatus Binatia bacterium]|nr:ABC transporter ATP-binding protein [Candidatus Binatia bacterium]
MIHLERLTKEYDMPGGKSGTLVAADSLDLLVPKGEIFGLVGPNGAGKTTTLRMMCGLLRPTAGRVTVHEVDVERHPEDAQRYLGYLSDFFSVYEDLKVWEYVEFFARAYKMPPGQISKRVDEVIHEVGLEGKRDAFIAGLSRGMKQRLGIARAVVHNPPVLLLDEPASGLDPKARHELKQLLMELNRAGATIFVTTHILSDVEEICTSVGIMEKGHLLRCGPLETVMQEARGPRRVGIRLAAPGFALVQWLGAQPGVSGVTSAGAAEAEFTFSGDDAGTAELVRQLVAAGGPVCGVQDAGETFEQLYARLSNGETM